MADIAASVLARLKNKAAESSRSYQLCLQLFCQEEFLRRLEKSKCLVHNKNTQSCRGDSSKLQREFPQ